jgi:cytidine diphosphoramidate kinase
MMTGHVYWITGLSGAGKSTLARALVERLRSFSKTALLLDGDDLRGVYGDGLGFTLADRRILALRNARLCRLLSSQGFDVVCATISLFHECHNWCRENIEHYHEIYLRVSLDELRLRDIRNLYQRADAGETTDVAGVTFPVEIPRAPHLVIDNDGPVTEAEAVAKLWRYVAQQYGVDGRAG